MHTEHEQCGVVSGGATVRQQCRGSCLLLAIGHSLVVLHARQHALHGRHANLELLACIRLVLPGILLIFFFLLRVHLRVVINIFEIDRVGVSACGAASDGWLCYRPPATVGADDERRLRRLTSACDVRLRRPRS